MLLSNFRNLARRHRADIPPCRSCGDNGTEGQFCRLFSTQERTNMSLSHARLAPTTYHGRVICTVTRVWVRAPQRRTPLTFHGAVARFVHRCLLQTLYLAVSDYHFDDCFSGRFGPACAHCVCLLRCFLNIGTCVVNINGHV